MEATAVGNKFTIKTMGMDNVTLKELTKDKKGPVEIFNVLALVTKMKVEQSRLNPQQTNTRFIGQFEVTNRLTGEQGTFPAAFFPTVIENFLTGQKSDEDSAAIVPFVITVEKDNAPNSAQGYKFGMKAFVDKKGDADPFKNYRNLLPPVEEKKDTAGKGKK